MDQPKVGMVAGETSGDLLASLLLQGLRARHPGLVSQGIGGPKMAAQGFQPWWPYQKLAVRGYVEVLKHYREIVGIRRQLAERLLDDRPDIFIGVDAPDFNLGLEATLKAQGVRTVHFVSPSIWAWRGKRIHKIGQSVDHMLCLFPFEPALYEKAGIPASYVGHPLADAIPLEVPGMAARHALGLTEDERVVALLPGSRRSEIQYILPTLLHAAERMHARQPGLRFVLPVVPGLDDLVQQIFEANPVKVEISRLKGQSHEAMAACDVCVVASGTATLEAALFKCPMVITYKMHWLSWAMMKRMKYQPWVGLPNILSEAFVVPELIQDEATPERLADEALAWLSDEPRSAAVRRHFMEIHHRLRQDTARAASEVIERIWHG